MFKFINRLTDSDKPQVANIPFPTARVPVRLVEPKKQSTYEEVANSLGFQPAELTRFQLLAFFEKENIELYDYEQVREWLTKKKAETGAESWCWRPLRDNDIIDFSFNWGEDGFYSKGSLCPPYDRLVPKHALDKVAKIEAKFGDCVKFFVSDYAAQKPDPFIMVRPAKRTSGSTSEYCLVFDVWDEPGFGEEPGFGA